MLAFALWMLVFGDDSTTFGYDALAIAVPLSLVLSLFYLRFAIRWQFSTLVLIGTTVVAVICNRPTNDTARDLSPVAFFVQRDQFRRASGWVASQVLGSRRVRSDSDSFEKQSIRSRT